MQSVHQSPPATFDEGAESTHNALQAAVRFLQLLWRKRQTISYFLVGTFALGMGYFVLAPRYYESVAKLMIIVQKSPDQVSSVSEQSNSDKVMASQRELISSSKVVQAAIEQLRSEYRIDLAEIEPRDWVEQLSKRLKTSTVRNTNHMEVRYQSLHPEAAAAVVESVINSYLGFVGKTHQGAAESVLEGHRQRLAVILEQVEEKQQRIQQLRSSVEALSTSSKEGVVDPVVSEAIHLHESLMQLREQRLELEASLATIQQAIQRGQDIRRHLGLVQEAVGEQVLLSALGLSPQDAEIQVEQQKQLLAAEDELRRISPYLGPNHARTITLQKRIESTKQYLASYQAGAGDRFEVMSNAEIGPLMIDILQQSVAQARSHEEQIARSYQAAFHHATQKSSQIDELARLQREVEQLDADRHAYDQKLADVDVHQLLAPIRATIVQDPLPSDRPATPRLRDVLVSSIFGGLVLGALVVYLQDLLDDRFSSPEEMASQLGLPVLTLVRQMAPTTGTGIDAVQMHAGGEMVQLEAFRTLRTALALNGEVSDRLVVSSSEPGDGKTTVSANLAVSFAQVGKRTLVIDADLRRPGMTALMGLKGQPGVTDLMVTDGDVSQLAEEIVRSAGIDGLDIIPAGPRRPDPAELLASSNFADLLAWADGKYDQILIDCPPVLAVSDAQIVGRLVDGVVVVVSPEKNHRRLVSRACENFLSAGVHVFGVVANRISEHSATGYGYGYEYDYSGNDEHEDETEVAPSEEQKVLSMMPPIEQKEDTCEQPRDRFGILRDAA